MYTTDVTAQQRIRRHPTHINLTHRCGAPNNYQIWKLSMFFRTSGCIGLTLGSCHARYRPAIVAPESSFPHGTNEIYLPYSCLSLDFSHFFRGEH